MIYIEIATTLFKRSPLATLIGIILALCIVYVCLSCNVKNEMERNTASNSTPHLADKQQPHTIGSERLERLREGMRSVQFGDDIKSVLSVIGQPDATETVGPKRMHGRNEDFQVLVYYVSLVGPSPGNINDRTVRLSFDHSGKLVSITSNVEGIESRP